MESVRVEEGRNEGAKSGRRCNFWCVAALFFFIGIIGLVAVIVLYVTPSCTRLQYGLIVDAGSSHSSLTMYRWKGEKLRGTGEVIEIIECNAEGPGISSYQNDIPMAGKSLEPCINEAKRKVPNDRHAITPIYLGATAGMRILKAENAAVAEAVFKSAEDVYKTSGFKYTDGNVRMVRDEEEGVYAWITANLVLGQLGQEGTRLPTSGALDLGGASTQIAFETDERKAGASDTDYAALRLYGLDFNVFTHSYLCYGINEAKMRMHAQIILNNLGGSTFTSPCFHDGHDTTMNASKLFGTTCTVPLANAKGLDENTVIEFKGSGNVAECRKIVQQLLDPEECKKTGYVECFDSSFVPTPKGKFLAMSTFFHASKFIDALKGSYSDYEKKANDFCAMKWDKVVEKDPKSKFSNQYCFAAQYAMEMLGEKYGLKDKWEDVEFVKNVQGVSMGWALGMMTNETNIIPTERVRPIQTDLFIALVILFVVLIIIVLILSYRGWVQRRSHARHKSTDNSILALCCPRKY